MGRDTGLVVGASGIAGGAVSRLLTETPGWRCLTLSRRPPRYGGEHVTADLTDADSLRAVADELAEVTHVFYNAYQGHATREAEVEPNLAMFSTLVEVLEPAAPGLRHIQLMHGTKWYGSHKGAFRTPAREDQPRHPTPVFYYAQQDWLAERQQGKQWTWSGLRPHGIWGVAIGSQLNMMNAIAVYATLLKHMALPLTFPGKPGAYEALYQMTDADHLAKAALWAATDPAAANEAFNITNGDFIRWKYAWPLIADWFDMPVGEPQPFDVAEFASDKEPMWERIRARHGLADYAIRDLTTWDTAISFLFNADWDQMSAMTKAQLAGFTDVVDTFEMIPRMLDLLAAERIIPRYR